MGQDEGPGGSSLKQEWQMDSIFRGDLDLLVWASWRYRQQPSRLEPDLVQKDGCD